MWAEFPANFAIWFKSISAWRDAVISDSYFTSWACALMDSDTTAISLLPAGIVFFLIPEGLEVCINIILSLSLLSFLLWSWFGISLLCLMNIVVSWSVMVYWLMMNWLMVDWIMVCNWMSIIVVKIVFSMFWVVSIYKNVLSVLGLIGFMDSLWVHMVVIEVVTIEVMGITMVVIEVVGITMMKGINLVVGTIEAINEWVVVHSFVESISMVIMAMMIIKMFVSMVIFSVFNCPSVSWNISMVSGLQVVWLFDVWLIESIIVISHCWTEMRWGVMFIIIVMVLICPFSMVSHSPVSVVSGLPISMVSCSPFSVVSVTCMVWRFVVDTSPVFGMVRSFMMRSGPVGIMSIFMVGKS